MNVRMTSLIDKGGENDGQRLTCRKSLNTAKKLVYIYLIVKQICKCKTTKSVAHFAKKIGRIRKVQQLCFLTLSPDFCLRKV